ncbi:AbiH family protein [uncultured Streptococcus sp.]|jgi:hypothetical protein|uniref:AbiH family protein n=1 Tax=uncultured Streptococcus sp. TaxID=83427 RepID=UPI0025E2AEB4|nr:AbiH family protein [uncultured Streptococcus sp.]
MNNSNVEMENLKSRAISENEYLNQLIILGNGFDLACGLKSSYSDFFYYIFTKKSLQNNYWYKVFNYSKRDNINKDNNWTDIESRILMELQILEFLFDFNILKDVKKEIENDESILAYFHMIRHKDSNDIDQLVSEVSRATDLRNKIYNPLSYNLQYENLNFHSIVWTASILLLDAYDIISSIEDVHQFLKNELTKLEADFKNFLEEQINSAYHDCYLEIDSNSQVKPRLQNYFWKTSCLISYIINSSVPVSSQFKPLILNQEADGEEEDHIPDLEVFYNFWKRTYSNFQTKINLDYIDDTRSRFFIFNYILSFNYTNPFEYEISNSSYIRNIHGDLDSNNLIFGIDYDKLSSHFNQQPIIFSKSYRILENNRPSNFEISPKIKIIKFYGHGLGAADYSYFQSIFDTVDLYHGTTKLIFFWSTFKGADKDFLYKEQVKKVVNLIEVYGSTFTNKNHGRNLLTKLQLENRLIIKEIKSIENL